MNNLSEVDRMLAQVQDWMENAHVSTVEQGDIAQAVLQLGGQRAVVTSQRIMDARMSLEDWQVMYDAYQAVVRLVGVQLMTAQGVITVDAPAETPGTEGEIGAGPSY